MPITRAKKEEVVASLTERFSACQSAVFVDYNGLTVADMQSIRRELRAVGAEFVVAKNRLIRIALENAGLSLTTPEGDDLTSVLTKGLTAVAFGYDRPKEPAELLAKFNTQFATMSLKGGYFGPTPVAGEAGVKRIATMRSKEDILAEVVRILKAGPQRVRIVASTAVQKIKALPQVLEEQQAA